MGIFCIKNNCVTSVADISKHNMCLFLIWYIILNMYLANSAMSLHCIESLGHI